MENYLSEESQWKIRGHMLKYNTSFSIINSEEMTAMVMPKRCRVAINVGQII